MAGKPAQPDLSEFEALSRNQPTRCKVARHLDALDGDARAKLGAALQAEHISHNAITKWLVGRGLRIGDQAVQKHRTGECCCDA